MKNTNDDNDIILEETAENKASSGDADTLDDSVIAEENMGEAIKKLKEKLKKAEAEKQEYLTGWQRTKAEMVNARKRDDEERKEFMKFANSGLIEELIPVLDSFDMAMGNKEAWEKADKNWRIGVEYIYSQLMKVLSENGVKEINPLNEKYDHNLQEAISHDPVTDEKLNDVVIQVVQKGYSLNGKLLKVPKVKVGEFKV
jgi:molecular chaperone GrpE